MPLEGETEMAQGREWWGGLRGLRGPSGLPTRGPEMDIHLTGSFSSEGEPDLKLSEQPPPCNSHGKSVQAVCLHRRLPMRSPGSVIISHCSG